MKKIIFFLSVFVIITLASCSPAEGAIQTAISKTQTANIPCSSIGWGKIAEQLRTFDQKIVDLRKEYSDLGPNHSLLSKLRIGTIKVDIENVQIDPCTEYARRLIIEGLLQQMNKPGDHSAQVEGMRLVLDGVVELEKLGVTLDYP